MMLYNMKKKKSFNVYELTNDITTSVYEIGKTLVSGHLSTELPPLDISGNKGSFLQYNFKPSVSYNNNMLDMNKMREYLNDLDCPKNNTDTIPPVDDKKQDFFTPDEINNKKKSR